MSNCVEDWAVNTNLVSSARAAGLVPISLLTSIRAASPAALWVGSGSSTLTCCAAGGPPAVVGARKLQPTSLLNAGTCAAAAPGITIISGDLATVIPVVWTCWAPSG